MGVRQRRAKRCVRAYVSLLVVRLCVCVCVCVTPSPFGAFLCDAAADLVVVSFLLFFLHAFLPSLVFVRSFPVRECLFFVSLWESSAFVYVKLTSSASSCVVAVLWNDSLPPVLSLTSLVSLLSLSPPLLPPSIEHRPIPCHALVFPFSYGDVYTPNALPRKRGKRGQMTKGGPPDGQLTALKAGRALSFRLLTAAAVDAVVLCCQTHSAFGEGLFAFIRMLPPVASTLTLSLSFPFSFLLCVQASSISYRLPHCAVPQQRQLLFLLFFLSFLFLSVSLIAVRCCSVSGCLSSQRDCRTPWRRVM